MLVGVKGSEPVRSIYTKIASQWLEKHQGGRLGGGRLRGVCPSAERSPPSPVTTSHAAGWETWHRTAGLPMALLAGGWPWEALEEGLFPMGGRFPTQRGPWATTPPDGCDPPR